MARKSFHPLSLAVAMACAGWVTAAQAVDVVWFGANGDWGVGGNWSTGNVPTGSDRAIINAGTALLTVDYAIGGYQMSGGEISGAGNLVASGAASWTGGTIGGFGGSLVTDGGLAISGSAAKTLGDFYGTASSGIVNNAAATWSGSGNLANNAKGVFNNAATGSFDIQTDADFTGGTFNNHGTLTKTFGAIDGSNMTVFTGQLNNTGSVKVQQGVLSLQGGGVHTGSFATVGADSWLEFGSEFYSGSTQLNAGATVHGNVRLIRGYNGGTAPLNVNTGATYDVTRTEIVSGGGIAVTDAALTAKTGTFSMSGGEISGAGNLVASGAASWTGGTIGGFGGSLVTDGGLAISGSAAKTLGDFYGTASSGIVNNAAATWSGSGNLANNAKGVFNNAATGSFDIQTDADFTGGTFNNHGTLTKTFGAIDGSNMTVFTGQLNNTGSVKVQQGVLSLQGGGVHTGSFATVGADSWLEFGSEFYSGSTQLNAGATVHGNVRLIRGYNGGTAPLNVNTGATYDVTRTEIVSGGGIAVTDAALTAKTGTFSMSGGEISGAGNLVASGAASWTGGTIGGFGGSLVTDGGLAISGSAAKTLGDFYGTASSGIVNNAAATWSGSGNLANNAKGVFNNAATGSFDIQTDADFTGGTFNNHGTLTKTFGAIDGSNMTVFTGQLNNTGSVKVQQGVLQVTTPFNNQGVINVAADARFQSTNAAFSNTGIIEGNGTVQTALNQALSNNGVISPGNSIGHLAIDGNLKAGDTGSLKFELTSLASFDQMALTGNVTLGGDIGVWDLGYTPKLGDSFVVMTFDQRVDGTTFASLTTHGFAPGVAFQTVYHDHDVTLDVTSIAAVPEPRTWLLMLAGIGVVGTSLRRRRSAASR